MSLASVLLSYIISVTTFLLLPAPVHLFVVNLFFISFHYKRRFMSLASVLLTYIISVTTFLILPDPVNLFVVNSTLKYGIKGTILAIVGTNLASLVLIAIAGFLIAGADSIDHRILDVLTLLGGLFLLYYGVMQVRDAARNPQESAEKNTITASRNSLTHSSPIKLISQAFAIGISNPKDVIFFIAFFPPFI